MRIERANMDERFEVLINSVGALTETALISYRAAIDAGASEEEARDTASAFIAALLDEARKRKAEGEEHGGR